MVRNEKLEFPGNDILQQYAREFVEDTKVTMTNLRERSLTVTALRAKWLNYLFTEKHNLERAKEMKEKILKLKLGNIKSSGSILQFKNESAISENDKNIVKLNSAISRTKENISYLEYAVSILNDFGFTIKNAIESYKLMNG